MILFSVARRWMGFRRLCMNPFKRFQMFQQLIGGNSFQKFQSFNRSNLI